MENNKITIFANFCIDSEERCLRMIDSLKSFKNANILSWCLNIRGKYKEKAKKCLEEHISNNLKIFNYESENGWIEDSKNLVQHIDTEYLLIWVEDHICLSETNILNRIINDLYAKKIDYLKYTFFHNKADFPKLNYVDYSETENLYFFDLDIKNYNKIKEGFKNDNIKPNYLLAMPCIINKNLFLKNLEISYYKKKYKKNLPFNFERSFAENEILPFRCSLLKKELFASIDDDKDIPNSSLIGRGLYKERENRHHILNLRNKLHGYYKNKSFFGQIIDYIKGKKN